MAKQYFIKIESKVSGPFSGQQMKQFAIEGKLPATTEISADQVKWTPITKVPALAPVSPQPVPSSPPVSPATPEASPATPLAAHPTAEVIQPTPPATSSAEETATPTRDVGQAAKSPSQSTPGPRRCDVFISYRRREGSSIARLIAEMLERKGFRVFLDVEDLGAGSWNDELRQRIDECRDFVAIITPDFFVRCADPSDVVRQEIAHAISSNKNIIPIIAAENPFPEDLPEDIAKLRALNGPRYVHEYAQQAVDKLCHMLTSRMTGPERLHTGEAQPRVIAAVIGMFFGAWQGAAMGLVAGEGPMGSNSGIYNAFTNALFWGILFTLIFGVPIFIGLSIVAATRKIRADQLYCGPWIPFWLLFVPLVMLISSVVVTGTFSLIGLQSYFLGGIFGQGIAVAFLVFIILTKAWTPIGGMLNLVKAR